jgi:hypothetical protein
MPRKPRNLLATVSLYAAAGLGGLLVALIVVLNLHIVVGLEEGYAASPAEVVKSSAALALVDVVLLVAGPSLAIFATWKRRSRNGGRSPEPDSTGSGAPQTHI